MLKINSYTDESGQDTGGKMFVVCTVIVKAESLEKVTKLLLSAEQTSKKIQKWYKSNNTKRRKYGEYLVKENAFSEMTTYYSIFSNKNDYVTLIGAHIAKSILDYSAKKKYESKIFIDKLNSKTMRKIRQEIKIYRVSYKKIRGLREESDPVIRLVDALCGIYRDKDNSGVPSCYKKILRKMIKI